MPNTDFLKPLCRLRTNRFRSRSLGAVAATAASAGLADSAAAAIIFDLTTSYSPGDTISFDGTPAGELELLSVVRMVGMMDELDLSLDAPVGMGMDPDSTVELSVFNVGMGDYLTNLVPGDTVDGSLVFLSEGFLVEGSVTNPAWTPGSTGYAGFVFDPGIGPLYGWLQIQFDGSGTDFTVQQWAYDDTGASIPTGWVPEPSTALLLGLGLVGAAAFLRRRRRSDVSEET
jgi:hypothetical protein